MMYTMMQVYWLVLARERITSATTLTASANTLEYHGLEPCPSFML